MSGSSSSYGTASSSQSQQTSQLLAFGVGVIKGVILSKLLTPTSSPNSALRDGEVSSKLKKKTVVIKKIIVVKPTIASLERPTGVGQDYTQDEGPEQEDPRQLFQVEISGP